MRKIYLAIILLLCAAGCSKETVDSRFVGKWQHRTEDGYTVTISILPDGTGSYASDPCSVEIMDDYIVLDFGFSKPEFSTAGAHQLFAVCARPCRALRLGSSGGRGGGALASLGGGGKCPAVSLCTYCVASASACSAFAGKPVYVDAYTGSCGDLEHGLQKHAKCAYPDAPQVVPPLPQPTGGVS